MDSPRVCWADHSGEVKNLNHKERKVSAKTRKLIFPGSLRVRGQLDSRQHFLFTISCSLSTIHQPMDAESVRKFCLSLPHVTEDVQWESDLLFRIGNKMFAILALDAASDHRMSFKCTPEVFAELTEREGIVPAPYVARYHWVALERFDALPERELKELLRNAYQLILEKLPRKLKTQLESPANVRKRSKR